MSRRARTTLALALGLGAAGASVVCAPAAAQAQTGVLVVQLPFTGAAREELLREVDEAARAALRARGTPGPERETVRGALGVQAPRDVAGIVQFGRSMGGTHVLTGEITPLTGQLSLTLRLYEVATGRTAEQHENIGEGEEATAIAAMLERLFAPGAMQPSAEERQREEEARRQQEEARRQQEEARRRQEEARRRQEEARRRAEEERNRRVYRFAEGGPGSFAGSLLLGARVTHVERAPGQPQAEALVAGLRLEGGYAVLPDLGLELGGALTVLTSPTTALMLGPAARLALPVRGPVPLRASAGVTAGLFQGITGARATTVWLGADARAEYDVVPAVTVFAGVALDAVPGLFASVGGLAGVRLRFGGEARPAGAQPAPSGRDGDASGASGGGL